MSGKGHDDGRRAGIEFNTTKEARPEWEWNRGDAFRWEI
jgi:hypothetical protein